MFLICMRMRLSLTHFFPTHLRRNFYIFSVFYSKKAAKLTEIYKTRNNNNETNEMKNATAIENVNFVFFHIFFIVKSTARKNGVLRKSHKISATARVHAACWKVVKVKLIATNLDFFFFSLWGLRALIGCTPCLRRNVCVQKTVRYRVGWFIRRFRNYAFECWLLAHDETVSRPNASLCISKSFPERESREST